MTALALRFDDTKLMDGEPRVRDLRLGEALGFERPRVIRELIESHLDDLLDFGPTPRVTAMVAIGSWSQREASEFWLSKIQAIAICFYAQTPLARAVRRQVLEVFMAWERGGLVSPPLDPKPKPFHLRLAKRIKAAPLIASVICDADPHADPRDTLEWVFRSLAPKKRDDSGPSVMVTLDSEPPPEADGFDLFLAARIESRRGAFIEAAVLYAGYRHWAQETGRDSIATQTAFGKAMAARLTRKNAGSRRHYLDVRFLE